MKIPKPERKRIARRAIRDMRKLKYLEPGSLGAAMVVAAGSPCAAETAKQMRAIWRANNKPLEYVHIRMGFMHCGKVVWHELDEHVSDWTSTSEGHFTDEVGYLITDNCT